MGRYSIKQLAHGATQRTLAYVAAESPEKEQRLQICHTCEHLASGAKCSLCGCPVELKARRPNERCDAGKW